MPPTDRRPQPDGPPSSNLIASDSPPPEQPARTRQDWLREQAEAASLRGQELLAAGEMNPARDWLERAHRIAPDDAAVGFALSTLQLRMGDFAAAASLLDLLLRRHDVREGWMSLAAARLRMGHPEAAATALGHALSRHVMPEAKLVAPLADAVVVAAELPGWCGIGPGFVLTAQVPGPGRPDIAFDGEPVPIRRGRLKIPDAVAHVEVTLSGVPLLGSALDAGRLRRTEGVVWAADGGIAGWAWHPADADAAPLLEVRRVAGKASIEVVADDIGIVAPAQMMRPRGFHVPALKLVGQGGMIRVTGRDGRDLMGSPLDPGHEGVTKRKAVPADRRGPPASARAAPRRRAVVVVPVYRGLDLTLACLDAVFATAPPGTSVVVVDDATPEPAIAAALDRLVRSRRILLVRHRRNRGFPASANTGLRAAMALPGGRDVVLLNSDALVAAGWLEGLREAVHAAPDRGSATPFSNDATILSYPDATAENSVPADLASLARLAASANPGLAVEIPTGVGFCMYLRRECLEAVGLFREDVFAQGYGEENDFCIRARHRGWRHVAAPGVYVAHVGGQSFGKSSLGKSSAGSEAPANGAARAALIARNLDVLERLHPGYHALIAAFQAADPLAPARRRLDIARWREARNRDGAVILVTHDNGGGVERVVRARVAALRAEGRRAILLRPEPERGVRRLDKPATCLVSDDPDGGYPNLRFAIPAELGDLARLLRSDRPQALEVHHMLGHDHALLNLAARLRIPTEFQVHDYAQICPRITLVRDGRYCGEPEDPAVCEACIAEHGRHDDAAIGVAALRARSAADLAAARRVLVPSADAATRLRRHFPGLAPIAAPLEDDARLSRRPPAQPRSTGNGERVVCVIGAIGVEKGYDALLACAEDAAARRLALRFVLVGHTPDDLRLIETGRVFVTGPYQDDRAVRLVREQRADLAWLPSIWPETWCFTLGHAWQAGLDVAAFDLGAPAQRIRTTGRGWLLPLGLPAPAVNNALLALRPVAGDV